MNFQIRDWIIVGNPTSIWAAALGIAILVYIGLRITKRIAKKRVSKIAAGTATQVDDLFFALIEKTKGFFIFAVALYSGLMWLVLPPHWNLVINRVIALIVLAQVAIWGTAAISFWIERYLKKKASEDMESATTIGLVSFTAKFLFFLLIFLVGLNNLGIDITALVAGLGVGGIAIALAVQNILGDLFASLTIVLDKPFIVGDFIMVGTLVGTIEHIGLKTTRIRSLSGEQLIFPNSDLLQSRIHNFKRMHERRVVFKLGVTYQTPHEKLVKIPQILRKIVDDHPKTRFDRSHFQAYGAFSLDFETVYYVLSPDYLEFADTQQEVYLSIHKAFETEGIEFAYPTQTLFLEKGAEWQADGARS